MVLGEHEHAAARGHEILHRRKAESGETVARVIRKASYQGVALVVQGS
jgi:hypothetical protein